MSEWLHSKRASIWTRAVGDVWHSRIGCLLLLWATASSGSLLSESELFPQAWSYTWMTLWCKRLTAGGPSTLNGNVDAVLRLLEAPRWTQLSSYLGMTAGYLHFLPQRAWFTLVLVPGVLHFSLPPQMTDNLRLVLAHAHFDLQTSTFAPFNMSSTTVKDVLSWLHHGEQTSEWSITEG